MSLLELTGWCLDRFGEHQVSNDSRQRSFDIPWVVLDPRRAGTHWDWQPETNLESILEEIVKHAEASPDWLEICGA